MSEHELEKLLGGFAADTLTPEETERLYRAALEDQHLFNLLADEQALKELLADPAVRHRLLTALEQKGRAGAGSSGSWLDWFRRPAGLAWAGGLMAAALAIVLGTKIYQDSLRPSVRAVATEEPAPAAPAALPAPGPPPEPAVMMRDRTEAASGTRRDVSASPEAPTQQPVKSVTPQRATEASEADGSGPSGSMPPAAPDQAVKPSTLEAAKLESASTAQPASPLGAPSAEMPSRQFSARALFYQAEAETASIPKDPADVAAPTTESLPGRAAESPTREKKQASRSRGLLSKIEETKTAEAAPMGIRYSLIMAGPGHIDLEVDPATAVGKDDAPRLSVQANQDGYLFVYYSHPSGDGPAPLRSLVESGPVVKRTPIVIPLEPMFAEPQPAGRIRLVLVFSRTVVDGTTALDVAKRAGRPLIEQVNPSGADVPAEHAVYAVTPKPSGLGVLSLDVPLTLRP